MRLRLLLPLVACALPAALVAQTPSTAPDTVAGRVTGTGGAPVAGAQVYVTRGPDRLVLRDTTDADGRWSLVFDPGTGDYLVFISAPEASAPVRRRVQRTGTERRFVVDATLATVVATGPGGAPGAARPGATGAGQGGGVQQLDGVRVVAQLPRPPRESRVPITPTIGGNERLADGVADAVAPADQGNALATASTVPGLVVGPGGAAVLGASPDQSLVTLNGLANGGVVPRDANTRTRAASATYDPSVGGFAGALIAVELQPGRELTSKRGSFTLDAPALRASTSLAEAAGLAPRALQGSYGQDGMLREDRLFYTTAVQASRRGASQASFANADADVLARNGLAASDVTQVSAALARIGLGAAGATPDRTVDNLSLIGQLDLTPRGNNARRITAQLNASQSSGNALSPTALPSVAGDTRDVSAALQVGSQAYVGRQRTRLNDFRASLSWSRAERDPGRAVPGGVVRLADVVPDGDVAAVPSIRLGGFTQLEGTLDQWTAEVTNDHTVDKGRAHRFRLHGWSRIDGVRDATLANARGTFAYQTLADLEAGRAASFTRTLAQPARTGTAWNGAAAISHRWAPSRVFQLLYGARLEGNAFLGAPAANAALTQALGVRTDVAPRALHVSPRAGFSWYLNRSEAG
ncbi:MAG: carboxypeptidase-like regulatory domain-containing protein, partial [Gemmatimonadaceae bacterium]|nr:carboxypeptidase-like regulatory domain-containing protein [Gemmatimonadaceae bacterium]